VFYPFARLLGGRFGEVVANRIGGPARPEKAALEPDRPRGGPPGGLVANAVVVLCLLYVVLWNVRTFDFLGNRIAMPDQAAQFGQVMAFEQGWGLCAPMPGRVVGWEVIIGIKRDGTRVSLSKCSPGEGGGPVVWDRPEMLAATYPNGRWRKLMQNLPAVEGYPYLLPCFSRYHFEEWNCLHPDDQLAGVEVWWVCEFNMPLDEERAPPEQVRLYTYAPTDPAVSPGPVWYVVVGTRADGATMDLLRSGEAVDWRRPDELAGGLKAVSRWQPWLFDLRTSGALKYFAADFARFQYEEHNRRHQGGRRVTSVEVYQVQE